MGSVEQNDVVVRLWDELSDFDAAQADKACRHLMARLTDLLGARNAAWVGAMRTGEDPSDPLHGWRVGALTYLHDEPVNTAAVTELKTRWAKREVDPFSIYTAQGAGQNFRAFTMREVMAAEWFDAPYYKSLYEARGIHDSVLALFPVNRDAESVFVLHGSPERGVFGPDDLALVARTLRGVKWFHRRLMLSHGLMVASSPLPPAERKVLAELLTGATEKEIAERLALAASTIHQYAASIYRKFGVKGRAGLMSLWLNKSG